MTIPEFLDAITYGKSWPRSVSEWRKAAMWRYLTQRYSEGLKDHEIRILGQFQRYKD